MIGSPNTQSRSGVQQTTRRSNQTRPAAREASDLGALTAPVRRIHAKFKWWIRKQSDAEAIPRWLGATLDPYSDP